MKSLSFTFLLFCIGGWMLFLSLSQPESRELTLNLSPTQGQLFTSDCMVETFDENPFNTSNWSNTGSHPWTWTPTGKATGGDFWVDSLHLPIESDVSDSRAIVFNSDSLTAVGIPGPHQGIAEKSFFLQEFGLDSAFLSFYQYYRNFASTTRVELLNFDTDTWEPVFVNRLDTNIETSHKQQVVIPVTAPYILEFPLEGTLIQVRFVYEGSYYFWIVDDVSICLTYPFPETLPTYVGDSLAAFGYDYAIDCFGGAIVPNQMVVQFSPTATNAQKDALRNKYGVLGVDSCQCSLLEQWDLPTAPGQFPGLPAAGNTLGPFGQSSDLNRLKKSMNAESEIDGADLNRYTWNDLMQCPPEVLNNIDPPTGIPANGSEAIVVAILDSGVDRMHPQLRDQIWLNSNEVDNNMDDDQSCEPDDYIGWNFIGRADEEVNNPDDNSCVGHGTSVAGIVNQQLSDSLSADQYKLLPLKTHNREGVGNLFDALCAHYYAIEQGAKVINDSWGFYSLDSSEVLLNMVDTAMAHNVLLIAAAGNDGIFLDTLQQYPACVQRPNVIAVASVNGAGGNFMLSDFSNQSSTYIDIAALGERIVSTTPGGGTGENTGTSFSAPAVAGLAGYYYQQLGDTVSVAKVLDNLFSCITKQTGLTAAIAGGRVLAKDSCALIVATNELERVFPEELMVVGPNPFSQQLTIRANYDLETSVELVAFNLTGQQMYKKKLDRIRIGMTWELKVENWPKGMYFFSVKKGRSIWTAKLIKQ